MRSDIKTVFNVAQPSLTDFLARFSEFGCVEHGRIIALLAEAPLFTDHSWEDYEALGAMLYVAHNLTLQGLGDGSEAKAFKNRTGVTSITSGSHRVDYANPQGATGFEATSYGQRFETLRGALGQKLVSIL